MDSFFHEENEGDSDDEEFNVQYLDPKARLAFQNKQNSLKKTTPFIVKKALSQDKTLFDFDEKYEKDQEELAAKERERQAEIDKNESKYISSLMKIANERRKEYKVMLENKIQKEVEEHKKKFGNVQVFVTRKYKEKLVEESKWKKEMEEREKKSEDVNSKGMQFFFNNVSTFTESKKRTRAKKRTRVEDGDDNNQPPKKLKKVEENVDLIVPVDDNIEERLVTINDNNVEDAKKRYFQRLKMRKRLEEITN